MIHPTSGAARLVRISYDLSLMMARLMVALRPDRLALVAGFVILVLSLLPSGDVRSAPGADKLLHSAAYGLLTFLALLGTRTAGGRLARAALILAFGGAIEIVQPHFGRVFEWTDLMANTVGTVAGAALALAAQWLGRAMLTRRRRDRADR